MRVTSKGQVTIPAGIRERFGFLPGAEVEFVVEGPRWTAWPGQPDQPGSGREGRLNCAVRRAD